MVTSECMHTGMDTIVLPVSVIRDTFVMLLHDFLMQYRVVVNVAFDQFHKKVVRSRPGRLRFTLGQVSLFGGRQSEQTVKHLL